MPSLWIQLPVLLTHTPQQILFHLVQRIASWFPDPAERILYETAAADFRIPYWDWALTPEEGEDAFLDDFVQRGVTVYGPNGPQLIANPLFSYHFRPLDPGVFEWGDVRLVNKTFDRRISTDQLFLVPVVD